MRLPGDTEYDTVTDMLGGLDEWQLHSILCHLAYTNAALVAAAIEQAGVTR